MRYRSLYFILALSLPLGAWGGNLTSFNVSKNESRNFSIMALHFDREVVYNVEQSSGGRALQLTLQNCQLDPKTAEELASHKGGLIRDVELKVKNNALVVDIQFSTTVNSVVWETRNPYSLILDISSVGAKKQSGAISTAVKKSPVEKQKTSKVAAAKPSPSKSSEIGKKEEKPVQKPQQRPDTAPPKSEKVIPESASSPQEHFLKGSMLRHEGKYKEALEHFQQARKDPDLFARSTAEIANIYRQLGKDGEEIAEWEKLFAVVHEENLSRRAQLSELTASSHADQEFEGRQDESQERPLLRVGGFLAFALIWAVILLLGGTAWLFFTVRKLQKNLRVVGSPVSPPKETVPLPETKPDPDSERMTKPKEAAAEAVQPDSPEPKSAAETSFATEKFAQEVFSLSEQGLSIQEIAEKLGLGQDEVRLILNLQREEAPQV